MSEFTFVEIFLDSQACEIGIEIGLRGSHGSLMPQQEPARASTSIGREAREKVVSLNDIMFYGCADRDNSAMCGSLWTTDTRPLVDGMSRLRAGLQACAIPFLMGDESAFQQMEGASNADSQVTMARMRVEDLRKVVTRAWAAKDFASVAKARSALGDERSPAEEAKFTYARRHI